MFFGLSSAIQNLNAVAIGDKDADLVLENCSLVNVYSREILPEIQIAISQDRIAYVGKDASHAKGKKTVVMDLEKKICNTWICRSPYTYRSVCFASRICKKISSMRRHFTFC